MKRGDPGVLSICTSCLKGEHICGGPCDCGECMRRVRARLERVASVVGHELGCVCGLCDLEWWRV